MKSKLTNSVEAMASILLLTAKESDGHFDEEELDAIDRLQSICEGCLNIATIRRDLDKIIKRVNEC